MGLGFGRYIGLSVLAASAVLYHAFATRQHFYPATVYLSTSKIAVATIGNLAFATALCLHRAVIKIFLGSLRDIEQEMIRERLSSAVMESLLALTIFREEFSSFFVAMFATLVFIKVLHWLVQDRVDYVEVTPSISRLQHLRIVAFMSVLLMVDSVFLQYTIHGSIQSSGQSVMLLFAFEYVIQASNIIRYFLKYVMSMIDMYLEGRWESKGTYVFYLELITDLLHLFVYCVFFVIVFTNYGLPLHLVRDLYSTFRNFRNRIVDFLRFRQVTARLDRLPDASAEDLQRSDGVCIICREEMSQTGANKKLYCGHVFHLHCLRSWLERQQNCPTCRASVFQRRRERPDANAADRAAAAPAAARAGEAGAHAADGAAQGAAAAGAAVPQPPAGLHMPHLHPHHPHHFHVPNIHHVRLAAAHMRAQMHAAQARPQQQPAGAPQAPEAAAAAAAPPAAGTAAAAPPAAGAAAPGAGTGTRAPAPPGLAGVLQFPPPTMWPMPPNMFGMPPPPPPAPGAAPEGAPPMAPPPFFPMMPPPFMMSPFMPPPPSGSPPDQYAHAVAAAAAMAATSALFGVMPPMMMMPPHMMFPPGDMSSTGVGATGSSSSADGSGAAPSTSAPPSTFQAGTSRQQANERHVQELKALQARLVGVLDGSAGDRNINAAVAAMQSMISSMSGPAAAAAPAAPAPATDSRSSSSSKAAEGPAATAGGSSESNSSATAPSAPAPAIAPSAAPAAAPAVPAAAGPLSSSAEGVAGSRETSEDDPQSELRRRRLQRFEQ
mmetsp:Transcript_27323/g.59737  ORF Transcript_27323/g.59737 Transcript_27323/m.59737 type:complete len:775 (+) Transcript_27323:147-2471(+)